MKKIISILLLSSITMIFTSCNSLSLSNDEAKNLITKTLNLPQNYVIKIVPNSRTEPFPSFNLWTALINLGYIRTVDYAGNPSNVETFFYPTDKAKEFVIN